MKRFLVALMAGTVMFSVAFASAAALIVNGGTIQAGEDTTLACDTDGVAVAGWGLETDDGLVHFVRVGGISTACFGADMFANITGGPGVVLTKTVPVTINEATEKLDFVTPASAVAIQDIHIMIEGPTP